MNFVFSFDSRKLSSQFFFNLILLWMIRYSSTFSYEFPFRFTSRLWSFSLFGSWSFFSLSSKDHNLFLRYSSKFCHEFPFHFTFCLWSLSLFGSWSFIFSHSSKDHDLFPFLDLDRFFSTFQKIMILFLFSDLDCCCLRCCCCFCLFKTFPFKGH